MSILDLAGFSALFSRYYKRLVLYASRYVKSEAEAQDIVQDCFVKLWERKRVSDNVPAEVLLYTMVRHACFNVLKHKAVVSGFEAGCFRARSQTDAVFDVDFLGIPGRPGLYAELYGLIRREADHLPARQREAFLLSRFEGLSGKEIAGRMNISEPAVHKLLTRAVAHLKKKLDY